MLSSRLKFQAPHINSNCWWWCAHGNRSSSFEHNFAELSYWHVELVIYHQEAYSGVLRQHVCWNKAIDRKLENHIEQSVKLGTWIVQFLARFCLTVNFEFPAGWLAGASRHAFSWFFASVRLSSILDSSGQYIDGWSIDIGKIDLIFTGRVKFLNNSIRRSPKLDTSWPRKMSNTVILLFFGLFFHNITFRYLSLLIENLNRIFLLLVKVLKMEADLSCLLSWLNRDGH